MRFYFYFCVFLFYIPKRTRCCENRQIMGDSSIESDSEEKSINLSSVKCFICTTKPPIKINKALQCNVCRAFFHEKCFPKRFKKDGSSVCCVKNCTKVHGNKSKSPSTSSSLANDAQPTVVSNEDLAQLIINLSKDISDLRSEMNSKNSELSKDINDLRNEMYNKNSELCKSFESVERHLLITDKNVSLLDKRFTILDTKVDDLRNAASTSYCSEAVVLDAVSELRDQDHRSKNVMFIGIPEVSGTNSDQAEISNILMDSNCVCTIDKVRRIGVINGDKSRLLCVTLSSEKEALEILRNKSKLPSNIKVFADKTESQRKYLKQMWGLARSHNVSHPGKQKTVKHIRGVPKLVDFPNSSNLN